MYTSTITESRERMHAGGGEAGRVAHDLNNVWMVIGGYGTLLLKALPAEDRCHGYAMALVEAVDRGTELTAQLHGLTDRSAEASELEWEV